MIRYSHIEARSHVDGPGERTVLFVQGCPLACKGCQNKQLWPFEGGRLADEVVMATSLALLAKKHGNVTISGGEPMAQPEALGRLVQNLRKQPGVKNIQVYSGYTWDKLTDPENPASSIVINEVLPYIDVLVDGPFIRELDDPYITYRGSRNQRPIDVQESLRTGKLVVLDWDNPEIQITTEGDLILPAGLADVFAETGTVEWTRMCGQTRPLKA